MKRRSLNKQARGGDVKKFRTKASNAGRGAGLAGRDGKATPKRRARNAGSVARENRLKPHTDPGERSSRSWPEEAMNGSGMKGRSPQQKKGKKAHPARPQALGRKPDMNRGAGNRSTQGDTHGGKKPYRPAAKVRSAAE
jgi:hypothetical protein